MVSCMHFPPAAPLYTVEVSDILTIQEARLVGRGTPSLSIEVISTFTPEEVEEAMELLSPEERRTFNFLAAQEVFTAEVQHFSAEEGTRELWSYEVFFLGRWFLRSGGSTLEEVLKSILKDFTTLAIAKAGELGRAAPEFKSLLPSSAEEA